MKKISLVVSCFLLSASLFAQTPVFGVKAGANISNINWEIPNADFDSRIGFHVGLLAHIHLSPQWGVQPELQYSTEGVKQPVTNGEYTWKTDYVNIPIMLQYMFDNGFRLEAGPFLGLMVSNDDNDDVFKSTNAGVGFGVNYLTYSGFGIGGRYNLGLTKITEDAAADGKSRTFQISAFYMFDNRHKSKSR
jgi:hypothetical protein